MLDPNSIGRMCKLQKLGGRGQWLSGRMLNLNSRGRKCAPQRWGLNGSVVECLTQDRGAPVQA